MHAVGGPLASLLGQLQFILAFDMVEESLEIRQRTPTRLGALKARRDARMQSLKLIGLRLDFL